MIKATGCLELPGGTHIDMVVDIIYHGASGPLYSPQSVDRYEKTWKQTEYEKLTQKGEQESRALGQATAECLKDLGMPDKLTPLDVYFRSTDVARNIKTAREFMEWFGQEYKSLKISDIQDIPGIASKASSKEVALKVMPQSGNNRTIGSGDWLLQSAPTPWQVAISHPDYDDDEKDPDEEDTPLPETSTPHTKLKRDIEKFRVDSGFKGPIIPLADMIKTSEYHGKSFMPTMPHKLQLKAQELGYRSLMLEYTENLGNVCDKAHNMLEKIHQLFEFERPVAKYRLYVTHDTNMIALQIMLNLPAITYPNYLTTLRFVMLHDKSGHYFVRTLYNGKDITTICNQGAYCHIDAFLDFLRSQINSKCRPRLNPERPELYRARIL